MGADVESFRAAVGRELGLRFDDDKLRMLAELLAQRMYNAGCCEMEPYLARMNAAERAELARALVVSETYFLRNRDQFRALEAILREREATSNRKLRLLSAGCSSGEEAYSLAIAVRETLGDARGWTVSIVGVDVNPDALAKARAASYSKWALRETPPAIASRYFRPDRDRFVLVDAVREMVRLEQHNLLRPRLGLWQSESYDVVFCRNVLMYFTREAAREVVANIARSLVPGGLLFLGHAENLRGLSHAFHLRSSHDTFYYERRHEAAAPRERPANDPAWLEDIARASRRIAELSRTHERSPIPEPTRTSDLAAVMGLIQDERFEEALRGLADADEPRAALMRAMLLVCIGDFRGAEVACDGLLRVDDLDAGAHYVTAICREHAGDREAAMEHSRTATYLDERFAMPHLQLGRLARRAGDLELARRELGVALDLLPGEDHGRIVLFGGGFGRNALMQVCRAQLAACGGTR